jgi:hypothetical protein
MSQTPVVLKRKSLLKISVVALVWSLAVGAFYVPFNRSNAASVNQSDGITDRYQRSAPAFDLNAAQNLAPLRQATGEQLAALDTFKTSVNAPNASVRWNDFGGSPDVIYDFASQPSNASPEDAARAFIANNAGLFGVANQATDLQLFSSREALGGHLLRFKQTFNGIDVKDGGIGVVMNANKQVIMASGPFFRDVNVITTPTVSAAQAQAFADNDLAQFTRSLPASVLNQFQPALALLNQQIAAVNNLQPRLGIYPTADGYRLIWKVAKFSANPFGLYMISVDAHTGEVVARKDFLHFQLPNPGVLPYTADIYPKYPTITDELKNQGIISVCNGVPCGQERVQLRKFDQQNIVTGLNGTLTGTHALVNNVLPTKQPFLQAARGTWHFRNNDPVNLEARTNEIDHFAEPAEHQDEINAFFFVTYLVEYIDYLHVGGDPGTFGSQGNFPDEYPNKTIPLPATVHMPNFFLALDIAGGEIPDPTTDPDFAQKALGMDNAFALNVTSLIESVTGSKSPVVVNPTFYGHGFLFNDLALEGTVPYHEGMHAITSPIAGLEGEPEGGALNEGQADMWAFTITDNPSLGDYVVNSFKIRQRFRDLGRDPDSLAYIRSAKSTLKYSDIGTLMIGGVPSFEEHYDGEIYMSTMWDIREMMNRQYPNDSTFKRPQPKDGRAEKRIKQGTEIFERDFLGAMYILGTTAPDTIVKSRDAMIIADQMLYPSNSTDATAPGKHRAMIEQIFAAHELGVNAREVTGGKATISTQVTPFVGNQAAPTVPTNVKVVPATAKSVRVSWNAVPGALAYQVLKRKQGFENSRQPNGKREFADGDASTTGFRHVAFVNGSEISFEDRGKVQEVFAPAGLPNLFDHDYVVRAIKVNTSGQLGFSNLSGAARPVATQKDVTKAIDSAISNINFSNGTTAFDVRLTNARGANATDKTVYSPIHFQITRISNSTVTVRNGDSGNAFTFNQTLPLGATSNVKRFEFNNPSSQLFTFDARILGGVFGGSSTVSGSQSPDGTSTPPAPVTYSIFTETKTGSLLAGDPTGTAGASATWGNPLFKGITWDDIEVTTKSDAQFFEATLSSLTAPDLDLELRTLSGQVLATSGNIDSNEFVSASVQPNTRYILRVLGFANGPSQFQLVCNQLLPNNSPNANNGTRTVGGSPLGTSTGSTTTSLTQLVRFTVNPLTRTVTAQLLQ